MIQDIDDSMEPNDELNEPKTPLKQPLFRRNKQVQQAQMSEAVEVSRD
jgi:hypothetical protein